MGGYNMGSVDEFLDELTDDYTALYKENTALKAKLKVLVEKVEDYRSTEDSMRATLLTAQKMADSIVREAEQKRDSILAQAETDAQVKIGQLQSEVATAEARLAAGQKNLAEFVSAARLACGKQLELLDQLPQLPVDVPAQETAADAPAQSPAPVDEIEQHVFAAFHAEVPAQETAPAQAPAPEADPAPAPEEPAPSQPSYPAGNPFEEEPADDDPTRRINLRDLKFGRNYSGDNK